SIAPIAGRRWALPALLLAAALLGVMVTWSVIRIGGGADRKLLHLTSVARLTHDPEFSESPTWSPDSKMLAFSSIAAATTKFMCVALREVKNRSMSPIILGRTSSPPFLRTATGSRLSPHVPRAPGWSRSLVSLRGPKFA